MRRNSDRKLLATLTLVTLAAVLISCSNQEFAIFYYIENEREQKDESLENELSILSMVKAGTFYYIAAGGEIFRRDETDDEWDSVKFPSQADYCTALTLFNGKLYAGVIPKAECYRYEADGQWRLLGSLASRPDWAVADSNSWCRLTCLTSFQGKLFASTGSCRGRAVDVDPEGTLGRVYALQAGQVVSHHYDVGGVWTHLAAVRHGKQLRLYVNGRMAATSQLVENRTFDLTNARPLWIGFGEQGYFTGAMADLRWYTGALDAEQVERIYAARGH